MADPRTQRGKRLLWGLQILTAVVFLAAGGAKLLGAPMMVDAFERIGVGQWFRYVTGAIEIGSGVALLAPGCAAFGALLLTPTMACAALAHVFLIGGSPVPALVLLAANSAIAWFRRDQVVRAFSAIGRA